MLFHCVRFCYAIYTNSLKYSSKTLFIPIDDLERT